MQALLTSQSGSTLSTVPSAVSDITSKLTGTLSFKQPTNPTIRRNVAMSGLCGLRKATVDKFLILETMRYRPTEEDEARWRGNPGRRMVPLANRMQL
ncbi:hypothetical protein ElyMa_001499800 [Elysia marginata]|uniref:Uncharacterized protein n=1 Tax=Elysia marginata TaxID=1093978 RepID=A0AAV4J5F1_9GAST|nr:hypothetical protein ElyMa_001499800 [Elysia marginata]